MKSLIIFFPLVVGLFASLLHWEVNRTIEPWDCVRCEYLQPHEPDYLVNL